MLLKAIMISKLFRATDYGQMLGERESLSVVIYPLAKPNRLQQIDANAQSHNGPTESSNEQA